MTLRADSPAPAAVDRRLAEASRALESMLLKQIVTASGAFKGGDAAGSAIRADLFASTLADAVAASGGIGLADELARSLTPGAAPRGRTAAPAPLPIIAPHPAAAHGAEAAPLDPLELPVSGRVTSGYGVRQDPLTGRSAAHPGIDFGAPEGTPIRAPRGGVVISSGPKGGYGNAVEIDHGDGVVTLYGHASELLVSTGEFVEPGQEIATVGTSGRSTGPHLHFEVRVGGKLVDPGRLLKKYGLRADGSSGSGP